MKSFTIARGTFGDATPFVERVTLERHRSPRLSSLTVSIVDGTRVLAERSVTFHGLRVPVTLADVERALQSCRDDIALFHSKDSDYCMQLMTPDPTGVVELASALAR